MAVYAAPPAGIASNLINSGCRQRRHGSSAFAQPAGDASPTDVCCARRPLGGLARQLSQTCNARGCMTRLEKIRGEHSRLFSTTDITVRRAHSHPRTRARERASERERGSARTQHMLALLLFHDSA